MEFSRQKYWSRPLVPSPGDLPNPGTEPEICDVYMLLIYTFEVPVQNYIIEISSSPKQFLNKVLFISDYRVFNL